MKHRRVFNGDKILSVMWGWVQDKAEAKLKKVQDRADAERKLKADKSKEWHKQQHEREQRRVQVNYAWSRHLHPFDANCILLTPELHPFDPNLHPLEPKAEALF
jgi:hypothetical protein